MKSEIMFIIKTICPELLAIYFSVYVRTRKVLPIIINL